MLKISLALNKSYAILDNSNEGISVIEGLSSCKWIILYRKAFWKIKEKKDRVEETLYVLEDISREIRDLSSEIYYDEFELKNKF